MVLAKSRPTLNYSMNMFDSWSCDLAKVEIADDYSRAILTIELMHVGANEKGLLWTATMLRKIAPLFRRVTFRYDLEGQEGSSHAINKLSSPHFDVGWTYSDIHGAWYDEKAKILYVKGEVTHPDVIKKLARETTDGTREINFGSMGAFVEEAICSICGAPYDEVCENGHVRNEEVDGEICYKVPTKVTKALHVALTNDPADGESAIKQCVFQELGGNQMQSNMNQGANSMPGGLAPEANQTTISGLIPSPENILKDLAERIKTIEGHIKINGEVRPEVINNAPQDQMTQDNMGVTSQFGNPQQPPIKANDAQLNTEKTTEESTMDTNAGQTTNSKVPENPKPETQDINAADPMSQMMGLLQEILARLPAPTAPAPVETQDVGELENANKEKITHDETKPTEHAAPGDAVTTEASTSEGNKKNKEAMNKPGEVATADNAELSKIKKELELANAKTAELSKKLEIQDNSTPAEFGGKTPVNTAKVEAADMSASERAEKFGAFGKYDACFKGVDSAKKFI